MQRSLRFTALFVLIAASLACNVFSRRDASPVNTNYSTKFPLPPKVSNFTDMGNGSINFQTDMSLKDTLSFYRDTFKKEGLTERTVNTSITGTTFSMVFDGDPSGQAIVIQAVDLGGGKTNVNIRYEKV